MLEATLARTQHYAPLKHTLVVVNSNHLDIGREQLRPLPSENVLVQPHNRDTGPGVLFALLRLARRDPAAIVGVFPSDHYVGDDRAFIGHVSRAVREVTRLPDKIVVLGILPDRPDPGFGYIVPDRPLRTQLGKATMFHVATFHEKPGAEVAQALVAQGGLWNSFVMVFRISRMLELLQSVIPHDFHRMWTLSKDPQTMPNLYRDMTPWNFSSHFLASVPQHLMVLRVDDVHWSDWGTRDSIERTLRMLTHTPPWQMRPPAVGATGQPRQRGQAAQDGQPHFSMGRPSPGGSMSNSSILR